MQTELEKANAEAYRRGIPFIEINLNAESMEGVEMGQSIMLTRHPDVVAAEMMMIRLRHAMLEALGTPKPRLEQ